MRNSMRIVKRHPFYTMLVILFLSLTSFTVAQIVEQPPAPPHFFPEGAVVYLQAEDLQHLVGWWTESDVKSDWEASKNHEQFENSRLYLKLEDRMKKWGAEGKFSFTWDNLRQASGTLSGIAIYDIGELKAIGATRIPFSKAQATEIWLARSRFVEKKIDKDSYYVEPHQGALAFAYINPFLLVSSDESLLTKAIANLRSPAHTLDQSEKWLASVKEANGDVSLFLDQESLQKNRYFQKYWIHQNVEDFSEIQSTWIDLEFAKDAVVEHRFFKGLPDSTETSESAVRDYIKQFQSFHHEFLSYQAPANSSASADHIVKMLNRFSENYKRTSYPPTFSGASERATKADARNIMLEQIDEPILQVKSETLLQASEPEELAKLIEAADPAAEVRLAYPLWDNQALFVRFPETLILQLKNFSAMNQQSFLNLLLQHFLLLNSTQDEGGRWKDEGNGSFVLQSFHPIYVRFQDPWIIVSNEENDFRTFGQNLQAPCTPPIGRYSEANWKNARWKYDRLMRRLDYSAYEEEGAPLFFSQNIASLLDALEPVTDSSVVQFSNQEVVRYELSK
jgi:hypothetical protein